MVGEKAGEDDGDPAQPRGQRVLPLRAGRSIRHAFVRFVNQSGRRVDVVWLNYEGHGLKYNTLLPNHFVDVNTFVGHPWIFRDADTSAKMMVQYRDVFQPVAWDQVNQGWPPQRRVVTITIPVYTLRDRCMQVVRHFVSKDEVDDLDLPVTLKLDLKHVTATNYMANPRPGPPRTNANPAR